VSFDRDEIERVGACIAKLHRHVARDGVALTGGAAIEMTAASAGLTSNRHSLRDLDFVISDQTLVSSSVAADFLIGHYHVPQDGVPKFLLQLVDPATRLRVDIFPDLTGAKNRARPIRIAAELLLMLDGDDMLEHKLRTLAQASSDRPVDEKHYRDAALLAAICGRPVPQVSTNVLGPDVYGTDVSVHCDKCMRSATAAFAIAPRRAILDLLGYV